MGKLDEEGWRYLREYACWGIQAPTQFGKRPSTMATAFSDLQFIDVWTTMRMIWVMLITMKMIITCRLKNSRIIVVVVVIVVIVVVISCR